MISPELLQDLIGPILVFLAGFSGVFALVYRITEAQRKIREQRQLEKEQPWLLNQPTLVMGKMTDALAAQVPMTEKDRTELDKELKAAGYYNQDALKEYAAVRTILVLVPLISTGIIALMVEREQILSIIFYGLIATGLGYSIPRILLNLRAKERARQLEKSLPTAVDLMSMALAGGQNLFSAISKVTQVLPPSHHLLASELAIVKRQAELKTLPHALMQLAARVQVPEVRNLAMILAQSERLGSETAPALNEYALYLRNNTKQRAEAKANKTMFWLLFPTLLCMWIPAAILLVGPALLEFRSYRQGAMQEWRKARQELRDNLKGKPPEANTSESGSPGEAVNDTPPVPSVRRFVPRNRNQSTPSEQDGSSPILPSSGIQPNQ